MRKYGAVDLLNLPAIPPVPLAADTRIYTRADGRLYQMGSTLNPTLAGSIKELEPARAASTTNIDLATGGLLTMDGVALAAGDRVVVRSQTTASQNGIYVVNAGAWTRATDADTAAKEFRGTTIGILEGTLSKNKVFMQMENLATVGTDTQNWRPFVGFDQVGSFTFPSPMGSGHGVWNVNTKGIHVWDGTAWQLANGLFISTRAGRPGFPGSGNLVYETDTGQMVVFENGQWRSTGYDELVAVDAASTGSNIALTGTYTLDGVALTAGMRVLARSQTTGTENGIWVVAAGAWTRATDADSAAEVARGKNVRCLAGTQNREKLFTQQNTITTFGTDVQKWYVLTTVEFTGSALNDQFAYAMNTGHMIGATIPRALHMWDGSGWVPMIGNTVGTAAQRPSIPSTGNIHYETDTQKTVLFDGVSWQSLGGGGGGPLGTWTANASGGTTINSTTLTDFTGLAVTVPVASMDDKFLVTVSYGITCTTVGQGMFGRVNADGTYYSKYADYYANTTGNVDHVSFSHVVSGLAAGNRVFKVQGALSSAGGSYTILGGSSTRIDVIRLNATVAGSTTPVGTIDMWPTATAPAGYLMADGSTFSSVSYPELAALLGDTYGTHTGTSYYLPDFRGRSPLGVGTASPAVPGGTAHTLAQKGGEEKHTLLAAELATHSHPPANGTYGFMMGAPVGETAAGSYASAAHAVDSTTGNQGSSTPFNVLDPYLGINFIIKATATGTDSGNWQTYTPTVVSGLTLGTGGTITGRYSRVGNTVQVRIDATLGTGFTLAGPTVSLPVPAQAVGNMGGSVRFTDTGTNTYQGAAFNNATTDVAAYVVSTAGAFAQANTGSPFTWAAGDKIQWILTYEAA